MTFFTLSISSCFLFPRCWAATHSVNNQWMQCSRRSVGFRCSHVGGRQGREGQGKRKEGGAKREGREEENRKEEEEVDQRTNVEHTSYWNGRTVREKRRSSVVKCRGKSERQRTAEDLKRSRVTATHDGGCARIRKRREAIISPRQKEVARLSAHRLYVLVNFLLSVKRKNGRTIYRPRCVCLRFPFQSPFLSLFLWAEPSSAYFSFEITIKNKSNRRHKYLHVQVIEIWTQFQRAWLNTIKSISKRFFVPSRNVYTVEFTQITQCPNKF